jgi:hypothetical protein
MALRCLLFASQLNTVVLVLALVTTAAARPRRFQRDLSEPRPAPPLVAEADRVTYWYGWQTLIADGAVVGLVAGHYLLVPREEPSALTFLAGLTYITASPVIHIAHGQDGRAGIALLLRLVLPTAGVVAGYLIGSKLGLNCASDCPGAEWGAGIGIASAVALDTALLAHEPLRPPARREEAAVQLSPSAYRAAGVTGFGIGGSF